MTARFAEIAFLTTGIRGTTAPTAAREWTVTEMDEHIERQAAIDAVTAVYVRTAGYKTRERVWETREAIQKIPASDVAPVVRCKECVGALECKKWGEYLGDDGFCSSGKK